MEIKSDLEVIEVTEPPKRKAGVIVSSVDELIDKLKNEAHVIWLLSNLTNFSFKCSVLIVQGFQTVKNCAYASCWMRTVHFEAKLNKLKLVEYILFPLRFIIPAITDTSEYFSVDLYKLTLREN